MTDHFFFIKSGENLEIVKQQCIFLKCPYQGILSQIQRFVAKIHPTGKENIICKITG